MKHATATAITIITGLGLGLGLMIGYGLRLGIGLVSMLGFGFEFGLELGFRVSNDRQLTALTVSNISLSTAFFSPANMGQSPIHSTALTNHNPEFMCGELCPFH